MGSVKLYHNQTSVNHLAEMKRKIEKTRVCAIHLANFENIIRKTQAYYHKMKARFHKIYSISTVSLVRTQVQTVMIASYGSHFVKLMEGKQATAVWVWSHFAASLFSVFEGR